VSQRPARRPEHCTTTTGDPPLRLWHARHAMQRRAKIICTLGPAVDGTAKLESLIDAGMDVARLNFSHGTHQEHAARFTELAAVAARHSRAVATLQDLCGPKIRTGAFDPPSPEAELCDEVALIEGSASTYPQIAIGHQGFAARLEPGDRVQLDDGRIGLRVLKVEADRVVCSVEIPGKLRDRVGVHLPARSVEGGALTDKDRVDLEFGLKLGVDYVAVSFVRQAEDLRETRQLCAKLGRVVPLIAKIETPPAVEHLEEVAAEADAVMVARGDLGVEFSPAAVPVLQRQIIRVSRRLRKPVIVATEMLQSMVQGTRPTRAEANDVANAVFTGADAVMLSAETATGEHPALAVQLMARIALEAERAMRGEVTRPGSAPRASVEESLVCNAADIADEIGAKALVAYTASGSTGQLASHARPDVPLVALSPSAEVCRRLALCWGVVPCRVDAMDHPDAMVEFANQHLLRQGMLAPGDSFVVVFGAPVGFGSRTNSIRVRQAG
jgi:pyruvate kinase